MNDFKFVETNSETLQNKAIKYYEEYTGESLSKNDAKRAILQAVVYACTIMINNINTTGLNNLLEYSTGEALDELIKIIGVERLQATPSKVTLKFTLSSAQATSVEIPKGTRATADGKIFFATDEALVIPSGSLYGEVKATATVSGEIGNGLVEGQISKIVDGVPYVASVSNTTISTDGRDIESDDDLKERVRIAPFSYSTAGAKEAYKYLALSANANVGDADPYRTSAGCLTIAIVKKDGTLPTEDDEIITDVINACNDKEARPLTDNLTVSPAKPINDTIDVTFYISAEDSAIASKIQADVENAVNEYKLWQTTKIGRDIIPDQLRSRMYKAGAYSVAVTSPT